LLRSNLCLKRICDLETQVSRRMLHNVHDVACAAELKLLSCEDRLL